MSRWAVGFAVVMTLGAMLRYPGGTLRDSSTRGYSFFGNFLSDLGMTVAYGGQSNRLGAILFVLGLCGLVLGLGRSLLEFVRLCSESPRARPFARVAGGIGLLVSAAFIGVALTPENWVMGLHVELTLFAFRVFPLGSLLLGIASMRSNVLPGRVAIAWGALTAVLAAYVAVLTWGPNLATQEGLVVQVAAQKLVAISATGFILYLCVEAERATTASTRVAAPSAASNALPH